MTRKETERAIAERLCSKAASSFGFEPEWHDAWLAVAREAMRMMERVALHERRLCEVYGPFAEVFPSLRKSYREAPINLYPALEDEP